MKLLDGKNLAKKLRLQIAEQVKSFVEYNHKVPHLAAILVGHNPASEEYVSHKVKDCHSVGFNSSLFRFDEDVTEDELLNKIREINNNDDIDGLIVQLPLPKHISVQKVTETIAPEKDVDGFHPINVGQMTKGTPTFISATPKGVTLLLQEYNIETKGKHCVVIGRSNIVGTPMSILMGQDTQYGNCTVTLCHINTVDLAAETKRADIIIVAVGKPGLITGDMVKEGAVVIDVGITRITDQNNQTKLVGDVNYDEVAPKCSYITPVPGGVGPMTRIALLRNTLKAAQVKHNAWQLN